MTDNTNSISLATIKNTLDYALKKVGIMIIISITAALFYVLLSISNSIVIEPSKFLKAPIYIDSDIIYNNEDSLDLNNNKRAAQFLNLESIISKNLVKDSLLSINSNLDVENIYPNIIVMPGEESLNKLSDLVLGDNIYAYLKKLTIDSDDLKNTTKALLSETKKYATIYINLSNTKLSEIDAKIILNEIIYNSNSYITKSLNLNNSRIKKINTGKLLLENTSSQIIQNDANNLMIIYEAIVIMEKSFGDIYKDYQNYAKDININDVYIEISLLKDQLVTTAINFPKLIKRIEIKEGNNVLVLKNKIKTIDSVLLSLDNTSSNEIMEKKSQDIVLEENIFNKILDIGNKLELSSYKMKLYDTKIQYENELSEELNNSVMSMALSMELASGLKTSIPSEIDSLVSSTIDLIKLHNNYIDQVETIRGFNSPLQLIGNMAISDDRKLFDKVSIIDTLLVLLFTLIFSLFVTISYFAIYRNYK